MMRLGSSQVVAPSITAVMTRATSLLFEASSEELAPEGEGEPPAEEARGAMASAADQAPLLRIAIAGQPVAGRFLVAAVPDCDAAPPPVYVQW